jgi:hypothetical protein
VLFYIGYLQQIEILGRRGVCSNGSCLGILQQQLAVVFTFQTLGGQIIELLEPVVTKCVLTSTLARRRKQLVDAVSNSLTSVQRTVLPKVAQRFMGADDESVESQAARKTFAADRLVREAAYKAASPRTQQTNAMLELAGEEDMTREEILERAEEEAQGFMRTHDSTFDDFNEMIIQYGYVAIFAPAYPLAPVLALINNVVEIRVDAIKLCHATQRPVWTPMADIGSWFTVLSILGFVAIITNSTMIAFVGYNLVRDGDKELSIGGIGTRLESTYLWVYAIGVRCPRRASSL